MARAEQIKCIIQNCFDGLETLPAATAKLDTLKVRGGFQWDRHRGVFTYCGYDYCDQRWVDAES